VDDAGNDRALDGVRRLLAGRRVVALTGAGLSTDSGIPDYRGPGSPRVSPMTIGEFRSGEPARQRYWARSHVGWARVGRARPNDGHHALAAMERLGTLHGLITQNVDGLHRGAGSRLVIDLHGRISDVVCLDCGERSTRADLQHRLESMNPGFAARQPAGVQSRPDGDAVLDAGPDFRVPACTGCGGVLKPDVVFFGENVPKQRVAACFALADAAEVLLVAGSSLTVMSGLRFVHHACRRGIPVVIVNRGPTRGDELASLRLDTGCSQLLTALVGTLAAA
jgi:NAD-dependent SIR2 family protein deacetylase